MKDKNGLNEKSTFDCLSDGVHRVLVREFAGRGNPTPQKCDEVASMVLTLVLGYYPEVKE